VLSLKEKILQHWFFYIQITCFYFESFMTTPLYILLDFSIMITRL